MKLQGTKYAGALYDADGERVYDLYLGDGSYVYRTGDSCGTLYESDGEETVSVGTNEYTAALYTAGTAHSGGLYTNFELAELTTRNVTALTV